jgi:hypothetical protein
LGVLPIFVRAFVSALFVKLRQLLPRRCLDHRLAGLTRQELFGAPTADLPTESP